MAGGGGLSPRDPFMGSLGYVILPGPRPEALAPAPVENPQCGLRAESLLPDGLPGTLPPTYSKLLRGATVLEELTKDLAKAICGKGHGAVSPGAPGEPMSEKDCLRLQTYFYGGGIHDHRVVVMRPHAYRVDPLERAMGVVAYYEKLGKLSKAEYATLNAWMEAECKRVFGKGRAF